MKYIGKIDDLCSCFLMFIRILPFFKELSSLYHLFGEYHLHFINACIFFQKASCILNVGISLQITFQQQNNFDSYLKFCISCVRKKIPILKFKSKPTPSHTTGKHKSSRQLKGFEINWKKWYFFKCTIIVSVFVSSTVMKLV